MRFIILALCAALLSCAPQTTGACDLSASHTFAFGLEGAEDTISVQSIGATCDKAIGLYVVRDRDGFPIWSWSAPLSHAFGNVFAAEDTEHVQNFLDRWAEPTLTTTQESPAWAELIPGQTTLDQLTYDDIRARNLPMLCHFSGTARQTCVFWEPAAGAAGHFLDRDVEETNL